MAAYCLVLRGDRVDYLRPRAEEGFGPVASHPARRGDGRPASLAESIKARWQRRGYAVLLIYIAVVVTAAFVASLIGGR